MRNYSQNYLLCLTLIQMACRATSGSSSTSVSPQSPNVVPTIAPGLVVTPTPLGYPVPSVTPGPSPTPNPINPNVCANWKAAQPSSAVLWSGNISSCSAGDIDSNSRLQTLQLINYYRAVQGLWVVTDDPAKNAGAQACALMQHANLSLSHSPPTTWACYSSSGAQTAGKSNIATTDTIRAIGLYMLDPGNPTTIGHRRWILSNWLSATIGIGSTSSYSCLQVVTIAGAGAPKAWTAFPPPGKVPLQAANVDAVGWTIQSDSINLSGAQVTITENGLDRPVAISQLLGGYGSNYAVAFAPIGWSSQAGHDYVVKVTGTATPINYTVSFVDCP